MFVTPNKEVVAKHGYELIKIAHQNQVQFLFETSVEVQFLSLELFQTF